MAGYIDIAYREKKIFARVTAQKSRFLEFVKTLFVWLCVNGGRRSETRRSGRGKRENRTISNKRTEPESKWSVRYFYNSYMHRIQILLAVRLGGNSAEFRRSWTACR